ncbi:hypothetical protein K3495_g5056 [Podosphaera aphanis]|nr:hypothetical protein K3495_g5056 [Podosphaera aphanis]
MAPPLVPKRVLPSDPPDAENCVSKPKPIASKGSISSFASRSPLKTVEANRKAKAIEKAFKMTQCFTDDHDKDVDEVMEESSSNSTDQVFVDGPHGTDGLSLSPDSVNQAVYTSCGSAEIMKDIKGLIDLTNKYLQDLEKKHPGVGADFLALLADGASRAMRGQGVYTSPPHPQRKSRNEQKSFSIKKQEMRAKPPQGQIKEDRRVMIRLGPENEARKAGAFELRQTIQKLIPDGNLVSDVWTVPSGVAILAPTAAKAATILQPKSAIENRFGNALVERQETWSTFVIGPIRKKSAALTSR